ncbi:MAG TPA: LPS export ABC transporter periplasmic protein LptC [Beijerinckiaceae bacterium]
MGHAVAITAPAGRSARAGARAYAKARRHSRRVRFFRIVIPVGATLAIGAVAVIAIFDPFGRMGNLTLGSVKLEGTKITMEQPRLTGYRKDARGYEVTAVAALQDVRKPTVIELKEMRARMTMDAEGTQAYLTAATGVFDTQKEQLELQSDIHVRTDKDQEAWLKSAKADFKAGTMSSKEPVRVKLTNATVEADSLDITDGGKVITFIGSVRTVIENAPAAGASAPAPQAAPAPPAAPAGGAQAAPAARTSQAEPMSLRP